MNRGAVAFALAGFACAAPPPAEPPGPPAPPRIYAVAGPRAIVERELVGELASSQFVVLGETHDNPEHHRLQARLLERLVLAGREPAVAFEMLRTDQQAVLDDALAGSDVSTEELRAAVAWDESGWPPFALYAPVFEAALSADLPIVGADLSKADRAGLRAADPELIAEFGLGEPLPADQQRAL
ncbi:MAG: ChaN family lipoprotein, partial [Myxococcota bacterium]